MKLKILLSTSWVLTHTLIYISHINFLVHNPTYKLISTVGFAVGHFITFNYFISRLDK
jgi:hypothetical protein